MRYFKSLLSGFFVVILISACSDRKPDRNALSATKPNIILILTDDQGWGDLSMNGNPDLHTPNIDQLAEEGVVFDHFYVCPLCAPTRAEMLTGRYYPRTGVTGVSEGRERLNLEETTLAELFLDAGYATAAFGKWHNGTQYPYHPLGRGFREFYGFCSGHWGNYFDPLLDHNGKMVNGNGYLSDDLTNRAISFIEENRDNPFFLYIPYNIPHSPMQVPDADWNRFKEKDLTTDHPNRARENINHTRAAYAMCENIDQNVGRILNALGDERLEEETVVIYLSDNGPNGWRWNGGMKGKKGQTDEGGVRSPFIIRWTGSIDGGRHVEAIAGAIDLLPTLTGMAGIDLPDHLNLDGADLGPLLFDDAVDWPARYIASTWGNRTSLRSQRFRLDHEDRLFDMEYDPGQVSNVSSRFPEIYKEMIRYRAWWIDEVLAPVPENDTRTFPVGHPDFRFSQLPARDALPHGGITRSNRFPNCTFLENWSSLADSITWEVEVMESGEFDAVLYYTCAEKDTGSLVRLAGGSHMVESRVLKPHDPPLEGEKYDRIPRQESYTKDFIPMSLGRLKLDKGETTLVLKAIDIPGEEVMDVRILMLNQVN